MIGILVINWKSVICTIAAVTSICLFDFLENVCLGSKKNSIKVK